MEGKKRWTCQKKSFTKKEAECVVTKNSHSAKQYRKECRIYYCDVHNAWHLSSQEIEENIDIKLTYTDLWKNLIKT